MLIAFQFSVRQDSAAVLKRKKIFVAWSGEETLGKHEVSERLNMHDNDL
jgi:hypothetical protein